MATNNASNIPTGTSGTVLQGQGAGVALELSTATYPSTTTANQLLYSSATNTVAGLANGTTGQVLTATTGSAPSWGAVTGAGSWVYISSATAAASATIDFTAGLTATYAQYMVTFTDLIPATNDVSFYMRTSTDGGATYDSGASDYVFGSISQVPITLSNQGGVSTEVRLSNSIYRIINTNTLNGRVFITTPSSSYRLSISCDIVYSDTVTTNAVKVMSFGARLADADVDAIRFFMSSGNIASGVFRLYGLKTS